MWQVILTEPVPALFGRMSPGFHMEGAGRLCTGPDGWPIVDTGGFAWEAL